MSFDLAVWYSDAAPTGQQAANIYGNLCDQKPVEISANPAVDAFYHELIAKWQEIDTVLRNLSTIWIAARGLVPLTILPCA